MQCDKCIHVNISLFFAYSFSLGREAGGDCVFFVVVDNFLLQV